MPPQTASAVPLEDSEIAARIASRDDGAFEAFEILMRRHNARLFRTARSILRDDVEAEDAVQDAYVEAYRHISEFRGSARLATWLTRIVINQALLRLRKQRRDRVVVPFPDALDGRSDDRQEVADRTAEPPSTTTFRAEIRRILERRIDELPIAFRTVFVMREVQDLSVHETAECLGIPEATVRTRLFRAKALLREALARDVDRATGDLFGFAGERCDRIVAVTLERVHELAS